MLTVLPLPPLWAGGWVLALLAGRLCPRTHGGSRGLAFAREAAGLRLGAPGPAMKGAAGLAVASGEGAARLATGGGDHGRGSWAGEQSAEGAGLQGQPKRVGGGGGGVLGLIWGRWPTGRPWCEGMCRSTLWGHLMAV